MTSSLSIVYGSSFVSLSGWVSLWPCEIVIVVGEGRRREKAEGGEGRRREVESGMHVPVSHTVRYVLQFR